MSNTSKSVFGIVFYQKSERDLIDSLLHEPIPQGAGPRRIETANVDHIVNLRRVPDFRNAYNHAWVVTADGTPVFLYANLRGVHVPERVTGSDLFVALMPALSPRHHRCFFLPSKEITAQALRAFLRARGFADESVQTEVPPFGFEADRSYSERLLKRIAEFRPTHLFFGVDACKVAIWVHSHRDRFGECYILNIGAGLDFFTGTQHRAPLWMRQFGIEWLWRFGNEPKRLFRRYFIESWGFLAAIKDDIGQR